MIPAGLIGLLCGPAWAQEDAPAPESAESSPLVSMPELVEYVQAPYPESAKEAGLEGVVRLLIEIDESGEVTYIEVLQSAGSGFDEAAVAAAWQFLFTPAMDESGPVPVAIEFDYGFVLDVSTVENAVPDAQELPSDLPVNLEGTLTEMGTRRPLPAFPIIILDSDGAEIAQTTTDDIGRFQLRGMPIGAVTVASVYPGYDRVEQPVEVVEGEVTDIKLWIRNLSYREDELVGVYQRQREPEVTRRTLTVDEVRRIPGTFGDPVRVIQNLPGAARSPFGSGALVIRGANPEDSGVYIDGIRIPLIYHLGGYVSVINSDLIEAVNYLPGSYGVQYGRSMGGVVDVTTKQEFPETARASWSTDLLDSGGLYQGRVSEDWGVAAAARRSYIDAVLAIDGLLPNPSLIVRPRWYDYQVKADRLDTDRDRLSVFVFGFQDDLLVSTGDDFAQGTDSDTQGDIGTTYSTHRGYVLWEHPFSDRLMLRFIPSLGIDGARFSLGSDTRIDQWQVLAEVRSELLFSPSDALTVTTGLDFIGGNYWFTAELPINPESFADYDPLSEREPFIAEGRGLGWGPDTYLKADIRPLEDRDKLLISPGVRVDFVTITDFDNPETLFQAAAIDPRLSARYWLTEGAALKVGGGIYNQPPLPFEIWRPEGTVELGFERSYAAEIGWQQRISQAVEADTSVFYKWLDDLIIENPEFTSLEDQYFVNSGVGRIYGWETIIRHAPVNNLFGWVSYTLSRSERNDNPEVTPTEGVADLFEAAQGDWYLFELDQTHILVAVAGYQLPRDWGVSGKVQYVTGNPYTPYSGGVYDLDQDFYFPYAAGEYGSQRLAPFFAVDARVDRLFTFKRWQLEVYLDLLNVLRGENPEFELHNYDYTESIFIRGLPFIPSPGFQADFNF